MPDAVSGETVRARKGKVIVFPPGNTCPGQYLLSVGDPLKMLSALDAVRVAKQSAFPTANGAIMSDIEKVYAFENLFKAYKAARLGKRGTKEEIQFETEISRNLVNLSNALRDGTYRIGGYYSFMIHDPKVRKIHALHFMDRVVQHSLCDNVLAPILERHLIYENAACRLNKGTDFARNILTDNLRRSYHKSGMNFWILKCDIRKYFDNINHEILKQKLRLVIEDSAVFELLADIIDSYETAHGRGIPLGNQTSQWFALYYLDGLDRLFKERHRLKMYVRYMDDIVILSESKEALEAALADANKCIQALGLSFNGKTQLFPAKNGVMFLGWRFTIQPSGRILKTVSVITKKRFYKAIQTINREYNAGIMPRETAESILQSYYAYFRKGETRSVKHKGVGALRWLNSSGECN